MGVPPKTHWLTTKNINPANTDRPQVLNLHRETCFTINFMCFNNSLLVIPLMQCKNILCV